MGVLVLFVHAYIGAERRDGFRSRARGSTVCVQGLHSSFWLDVEGNGGSAHGSGGHCKRARAKTLAHARYLAEQLKRKLSEQSNQPVWVAVQNRGENDPDQYWIGKALGIVPL